MNAGFGHSPKNLLKVSMSKKYICTPDSVCARLQANCTFLSCIRALHAHLLHISKCLISLTSIPWLVLASMACRSNYNSPCVHFVQAGRILLSLQSEKTIQREYLTVNHGVM